MWSASCCYVGNDKGETMITFEIGNICDCHVDAVVNPTDTRLSGSGGIDRAIHIAAGEMFDNMCKNNAPCQVGQVTLTSGGNLFAKHVIHTAVPMWEKDSQDAEYLLAACYVNSLDVAKENNINSIAFPAIGTGSKSFPTERAAEIAMTIIWEWYVAHEDCPHITIVMTSDSKMQIYKKHFLLNVIKSFKNICSPEHLAFSTAHTLPYYFEEYGGFTKLPEVKEEQMKKYRKTYMDIHMLYCDYMNILYHTIGRPDYYSLIERGLSRVDSDVKKDEVKEFLNHLNLMQFDECVCFIVFLQRMDYASGGASNEHLKNCMNGNIIKVLNHMENLLTEE